VISIVMTKQKAKYTLVAKTGLACQHFSISASQENKSLKRRREAFTPRSKALLRQRMTETLCILPTARGRASKNAFPSRTWERENDKEPEMLTS
jgi:hypothetical protein